MALEGIRPSMIEKVSRLSDLLVRLGEDRLLGEVLCLYGGTALNLLHIREPPRLSEDLDFNYRHDSEADWGEVRSDVDLRIKGILLDLGYTDEDVRIQPRYNLGRFHVKYSNREGMRDSLKVEIGYTRRMPVLRDDARITFHHPIGGDAAVVRTPKPEELFANKVCTMLSRKGQASYLRDAFDVATISRLVLDRSLLVDVFLVEALLCEVDIASAKVRPLAMDQIAALRALVGHAVDLRDVQERALGFSSGVLNDALKRGWDDFHDAFWETGTVGLDHLENPGEVNPSIEDHPLLRWVRERRSKGETHR